MSVKNVLFYNQGNRGWTEVYYGSENDPKQAVQNFGPAAQTKFTQMRHLLTQLVGMRSSVVTDNRNSYFQPFFGLAGLPGSSSGNPTPDIVSTDAVVRLETSQPAIKRRVFLRGLRDEDVGRNTDGTDALSPNLNNQITSWRNTLIALGWQVRSVQQPPAGGLIFSHVLSATTSVLGEGFTDLTVGTIAGGLLAGQSIRFVGMNHDNLPGFPRTAVVVRIVPGPPNIITVAYRFRASGPVQTPRAYYTPLVYLYTNISGHVFERFSEHKTGRPSVTLRGRARALVRAQ